MCARLFPSSVTRPWRCLSPQSWAPRGTGASVGGQDGSFWEAKYAALSSTLDQINCCVNRLLEKDDHLHACPQGLQDSDRQTLLGFQQQLQQAPSNPSS
ncbi:unnamed protein product [Nyctereutes procyonoides]|uniref:(raccoon dog) hypothetical protein n=1 Tax=Nyctereutes procyonoides TaxID=34880 RepID=A0A811Y733_NYCPR|nr:unnamed protein product [Nyctereutes procyonoides]